MKKTVKKMSEPREYDVIAAIICDICGLDAKRPMYEESPWFGGPYDVNVVEMQHKEGTNYPEGGDVKKTVFDICPECWRRKVLPFMEAIGAKPRKEESYW